jgi:hypothetical protein
LWCIIEFSRRWFFTLLILDEARDEIINCGAAPYFVELLVSGNDILKEYAAGVFVVNI